MWDFVPRWLYQYFGRKKSFSFFYSGIQVSISMYTFLKHPLFLVMRNTLNICWGEFIDLLTVTVSTLTLGLTLSSDKISNPWLNVIKTCLMSPTFSLYQRFPSSGDLTPSSKLTSSASDYWLKSFLPGQLSSTSQGRSIPLGSL